MGCRCDGIHFEAVTTAPSHHCFVFAHRPDACAESLRQLTGVSCTSPRRPLRRSNQERPAGTARIYDWGATGNIGAEDRGFPLTTPTPKRQHARNRAPGSAAPF